MAKPKPQPEVLVLGNHPAAHFAAALLRQNAAPPVVAHAAAPGEKTNDRLVALNPAFFELHKLLAPLKRKLQMTPVYGIKFLADDPKVQSEWSSRTIVAYITSFRQLHSAVAKLAKDSGVQYLDGAFELYRLDENGLHVGLNGRSSHPKLLLLAANLPSAQRQMLGLPPAWDVGVVHRYTFVKLSENTSKISGKRPLMIMSLDLHGRLWWAWLLHGPGYSQLAVEQPLEDVATISPNHALRHWASVLVEHGEVNEPVESIDFDSAVSLDLPLAGALAQEGVANRTLLIGPAGGFYTACGEDIYPNCWSAIFAVEAARKALKERHLQDALQSYRHKWGATLGDFLRGPQQNLRYLLPLVYRNPQMTARLAESILLGKSVVR